MKKKRMRDKIANPRKERKKEGYKGVAREESKGDHRDKGESLRVLNHSTRKICAL